MYMDQIFTFWNGKVALVATLEISKTSHLASAALFS